MKKIFSLILLLVIGMGFTTLQAQETLKSYQNYDFIPGDKIIFEDDFSTGLDGEFPPLWKLLAGQGVVNKFEGKSTFVITEGSYARMAPRVKNANYLDNTFTVEVDYFATNDDPGLWVFFVDSTGDDSKAVHFDQYGNINTDYFPETGQLEGRHPQAEEYLSGFWRHAAIAYKNSQMKCYVDQYRVLVIPEVDFTPLAVHFGGSPPVRISNVKVANGGGMNLIDQITKDGKFITHGILFDVNKATIKPSSMGVLNDIVKMMKDHSDLKFSVEGHTDSDGDDKSNQILSEQRAESVKKALVDLGIDASRLQTKGWGESKPMGTNDTPEGKANNRRVEFVKI